MNSLNFKPFASAVAVQFALMSKHELYTTKVAGDDVYTAYLAAFPEGTNPMFRERTEHDCSCCRSFIKNIGNLVAIIDGKIVTIWDTVANGITGDAYEVVATKLVNLVSRAEIDTIYRTSERAYGALSTTELRDDGTVKNWNHFNGSIAGKHLSNQPGTDVGHFTAARDVFKRGLTELTTDALDIVLALISENQLYRGDEHKKAVVDFRTLHAAFRNLKTDAEKQIFINANAMAPASRFRNSAIGTLVIDLSAGVDEETAVKSFEKKVAPENYKRPTAMVTEGMKKKALDIIKDLGLEDSLVRRLAAPSDITVNNVLWANGAAQATMKGGIAGIMDSIPTASNAMIDDGKATDISITDFLSGILPRTKSLDMMVKSRHLSNLMALTAPVHGAEGKLFKWSNDFGWTYTGNISDSIKERVKAAGGSTDAVLRVSLAWHNGDDLDLHAHEPHGPVPPRGRMQGRGDHIYFGNRGRKTELHGGMLDVDMNAGRATNSKDPVENITWSKPGNGEFRIDVNNFTLRDKSNSGYTLQVENAGVVYEFSSPQSPPNSQTHTGALIIEMKDGKVVSIKPLKHLQGGGVAQDKWGITTETPVPVNMVLLSPNYWDDNAVGNKHYMFILEGCKTDEPLRGILNEYLSPKLEAHRKVFEVLGDKTKCQPTENQLAGLGFSTTKGDSVMVRAISVDGKQAKVFNIIF